MNVKHKIAIHRMAGISVILIAAILILSIKDRPKLESQLNNVGKNKLISSPSYFPVFSSPDLFGTQRNSADFRGKYVYVQFAKDLRDNKLGFIIELLSKYTKRTDFVALVISENAHNSKSFLLPEDPIYVIAGKYDEFKSLFRASLCCDIFSLYDKEGKLLYSYYSQNNEDGIKNILARYIDKQQFSFRMIISEGKNIADVDWLEQINLLVSQNKYKYYVVCLMAHVCSSCMSGSIIDRLNLYYEKFSNNGIMNVIILLNHSYDDIKILRKHFNIRYDLIAADDKMTSTWRTFANEFGEAELTNVALLLNAKGEVINIMEPNCGCLDDFINKLKIIIGE